MGQVWYVRGGVSPRGERARSVDECGGRRGEVITRYDWAALKWLVGGSDHIWGGWVEESGGGRDGEWLSDV